MSNIIYFYGLLFLASIFAFLKLFIPCKDLITFGIYGTAFSIAEFLVRVPTLYLLNYSVLNLQIIWVSFNFISSSILSYLIYKETIAPNKIIGMLIILFGIYIVMKK
jgi:hypothetical protein